MSRLFSGTPFDRPISCPKCHQAVADCNCLHLTDKKTTTGTPGKKAPVKANGLVLNPKNSSPPPDQLAKIRTEKRKGSKTVTIITGLDHPANDLPALCTSLKQSLGVGGSVQQQQTARTIELQGDQSHKVADLLTRQGIKSRVV